MAKKREDITNIVNQHLCHSCGSCFASCGHDSISYLNTVGGYLFPKIDYNTCTNCGLCYDVCPGDHFTDYLKKQTPDDPFVGTILESYTGVATNETIYRNSQSGGVVTGLLKYLLESGEISAAIVTNMNMQNNSYSEAKFVTTVEELVSAQKSKYIPTNITSLLQNIDKIDGTIAMVGLSCHMHGLENLLTVKKKLKNKIIKIGLICDRVMTSSSVDFLSKKITNKSITNFVFRDTVNSPYPGDISLTEMNGNVKKLDKKSRMMMKDYFTPARCLLCFDKMNVYADIVVGDPHGINDMDRINGESLVIVRNLKAKEILEQSQRSRDITIKPTSTEIAIKGQSIEAKRKKWNANYTAWKEMGHDLPSYPDGVELSSIIADRSEVDKAKKSLKHALSLDDYTDRDALLKNANDYYFNEKRKEYALFPVTIWIRIIKKIIRIIKR
ncbi:MAG: Coenzyme F420 hydrogenase/dehydrogenase, beta subunit C-terminal domain [Campylobacterota bacterium]|nr:Coenzyme F420 hydrogenase/dehydrogenase, beta subunit C-terminal domain [Campylobacterota bacterium]